MVQVDLITGFLGAGKTTFIHKYLHYLKSQGLNVRMIENEFGDVSVDTLLLRDDDCDITDLAGLCMCCVGKDAFIKMLIESAQSGCDRIIVEPSGIYDVDEFFEVMSLPKVNSLCEIGSILTIADPYGMDHLTDEAEYLLYAQLLASGMVILSKTQMLSDSEIQKTQNKLDAIMKNRGCENGLLADLCIKPWDQLTDTDFEDFMDAYYRRFVHDRELFSHSDTFSSLPIIGHPYHKRDLEKRIDALFNSPSCGKVYRVKGFVKDSTGVCYEVNCTSNTYSIEKADIDNDILVLIGQNLRAAEIRELFSKNNTFYI